MFNFIQTISENGKFVCITCYLAVHICECPEQITQDNTSVSYPELESLWNRNTIRVNTALRTERIFYVYDSCAAQPYSFVLSSLTSI